MLRILAFIIIILAVYSSYKQTKMTKKLIDHEEEVIDEMKKGVKHLTGKLYDNAKKLLYDNIRRLDNVEEAKNYDGIIELPWCGEENCAQEIENLLDKNTLGLPIEDDLCEYSCPLCNKKAISWMRYAKTY